MYACHQQPKPHLQNDRIIVYVPTVLASLQHEPERTSAMKRIHECMALHGNCSRRTSTIASLMGQLKDTNIRYLQLQRGSNVTQLTHILAIVNQFTACITDTHALNTVAV